VFNGILVAAQALGPSQGEFFGYRLTLRPWLWLLTRTTDYRIFQDKKVPAIIKEVFKDRGFTDFESKIEGEGSFPTLEYCVQYRETDFNFVSRLMEKEGIYYFFKHEDGKHTLVLANAKSSHQAVPGHATTTFHYALGARFTQTDEIITDWTSSRQIRSGVFELNDYNYEQPKTKMSAIEFGPESYTRSDMEIYDYPGNYKDPGVGSRYAQIAIDAEQAQDHRRFGSGTCNQPVSRRPHDPEESGRRRSQRPEESAAGFRVSGVSDRAGITLLRNPALPHRKRRQTAGDLRRKL
jgi:type VI secretion system secreted protein VgrG